MKAFFVRYKSVFIYFFIGLIFLGLLVADLMFLPVAWSAHKQDAAAMKGYIKHNEEEIARLKTENEVLSRKIEYYKTDAGAEEAAREMGMVGKDDTAYVVDKDKFAPLESSGESIIVPKDYEPMILHKDPVFKVFENVLF
ncbi:septum formation initiator family protein [bacterium]|nr:septum formation initiator family protein [bacterium]